MKRKKLILVTGLIAVALIAFALPYKIFADQNPKSIKLDSYKFKSDKERDRALKVEAKLNDAWKDIKATHKIDDSGYTVLSTIDEQNSFANLKIPGFNDEKIVNDIMYRVTTILNDQPIGSTMPVIMVKNDLTSFEVCYKLENGDNVRNYGVLKKGQWEIKTDTKQGKPQKSVN